MEIAQDIVAAGVAAPAAEIAALPGPPGLPLLGNARQIDPSRYHLILEEWARRYGPVYRFHIGRSPLVVIADHRLLGALLRQRPVRIRRSLRTANVLAEMGPPGLFNAEGEQWQRQRKLVMRAFTPEVVRNFFPTAVALTARLERRWREAAAAERPIDIGADLKCYAVDVTSLLALGTDVGALGSDSDPLQRDLELVFAMFPRRVTSPIPYWRFVKLPADRRLDAACARLAARVDALIACTRERLAAQASPAARARNVIEALVAARDEPGSEFTEDDVRGNVLTMLLAGEDTTANSLAWLIHLAASDRRVCDALAAEADAVLGDAAVLADHAALPLLRLTEAAAFEAMRLKPAAPLQVMNALTELQIAGLRVPAGTPIVGLARAGAHDPELFPRADAFDPWRWIGGDAARTDAMRHALFPFGAGARFCPGRYLAMAEIKLVASMLFRNFRLHRTAGADTVTERYHLTMGPSALPVALTPRRA